MAPQFTRMTSHAALLLVGDIDTDQIIPARFLKVTSKEGLGANLFSNWRYDAGGAPRPEFSLNRPDAAGAKILIAGPNFGCGSSREHAPWALVDWGLRAVIAPSFADIFRNNALKNGLVPVELERAAHTRLVAACEVDPRLPITVDLEREIVEWPGQAPLGFSVERFARRCLLEGTDELGILLSLAPEIAAYEAARP